MKSKMLTLITAAIFGLFGGSATQFFITNPSAQAGSRPAPPIRTTGSEPTVTPRRRRAPPSPPSDAPEKISAKSLGLVHRNAWAADLYVDTTLGRTRLDLRDSQGRIGMILSVWDKPRIRIEKGVKSQIKAQIEFFDQNGKRVGVIDGTGTRSAIKSLPPLKRKVPSKSKSSDRYDIDPGKGDFVGKSDIDLIWAEIDRIFDRLNKITN